MRPSRTVPGVQGRGRTLAQPAFPQDDGAAEPGLREDLAQGAGVERLAGARLLVAVVAVADELGPDGSEKASHMAVVSMMNAAGGKGLLAFTGMDAMAVWDPQARPVPVTGADAARAAIADGADALVIDVLGPQRHVVQSGDLQALAAHAGAIGS